MVDDSDSDSDGGDSSDGSDSDDRESISMLEERRWDVSIM